MDTVCDTVIHNVNLCPQFCVQLLQMKTLPRMHCKTVTNATTNDGSRFTLLLLVLAWVLVS